MLFLWIQDNVPTIRYLFPSGESVKDYPYKYLHPVLTKKLSVTSIVPFAEIYTGHMVLVSDESENIYGVYDDEILLYGKNYNKLINLLYRNEDKGKLSY